jgi:hypothetical protein
MQWLKVALPSVVLTLPVAPVVAGETVSHPQLGFRLTVPDGFVQDREQVQGKVVYAFQRPPTGDRKTRAFIVVRRLGGVIGREKIDPKQVTAQNPRVTISAEKWKGFDIEVVRVPEQLGDHQVVTFNAQVPLKPEAVQIAVIGDAGEEDELRGVIRSVLGNVDGESNWLNTEQQASRLAEGIIRLSITVGVLVVVAVVIWRAFRKRKASRRAAEPREAADRPRE